jgi:hypothetical protein
MLFMNMGGNLYIKVAGLLYIAGKIGYQRIEIRKIEGKNAYEALIYPKVSLKQLEALSHLSPEVQRLAYEDLTKPTNGYGSASEENVKMMDMWKFLPEMAQTRALGRALRNYTGYGGTTYEELPDATVEVD